jgi:hypothetical protein
VREIGQKGREAAAWAVAARVFEHLGGSYRLGRGNPSGSQTNVLWLLPKHEYAPHIHLNPDGRAHVGRPLWPEEEDRWTAIADGRASVAGTAKEVLARIPDEFVVPPKPGAEVDGVRLLASLARHAALFNRGWRLVWGIDTDVPHASSDRTMHVAGDLFAFFDATKVPDAGASFLGVAGNYWFLVGEESKPLLRLDLEGRAIGSEPTEDPVDWGTEELAGVHDEILKRTLALIDEREEPRTTGVPELGLPALLAQFNRKERFWLLEDFADRARDEMHGASLPVGVRTRQRLSRATGWQVPSGAWAAFDYHLSWIAGAIEWLGTDLRPDSTLSLPLRSELVTGTQEDADLILAWAEPETYRVILVEAKGVTGWSNSQARSKMARISAIADRANEIGVPIEWRFVMASPRQPTQIDTDGWPSWALKIDGTPMWVPLSIPTSLVKTQRCNEHGVASQSGSHWQLITER